MKRKTPLAPVGHMLESAVLATSYVKEMSKDDFLADNRTRQAVIMNLLIIGEMAGRLARDHKSFCEDYPDAPGGK